jgi:tetratricopeptide (TPR) repeat protein
MQTTTIQLTLNKDQKKRLLDYNEKIEERLEQGKILANISLQELINEMSNILSGHPEIAAAIEETEKGNHILLNLQHKDNRIVNLPWMKAKVDGGRELSSYEYLYLSKSPTGKFDATNSTNRMPLPLKVLVVVSSPEDIPPDQRLDYEKEEYQLLKAFEKLIDSGLVEIDFADDASLETLKQKVKANHYHIFHFSGHSKYDAEKNKAYLQMEDPVTMNTQRVEAKDFVRALNYKPKNKPPLVVLSSCQSGMGDTEASLSGISNRLVELDIPAVVSMGWSIGDDFASQFTAAMYEALVNEETLPMSFKKAVDHLYTYEAQWLAEKKLLVYPFQYLIPNLYLSRECEEFIDWNAPRKELKLNTSRYLFFKELLEHDKDYLFIGRRKDKREILKPLFDSKPIMLLGQGGVGKTAMAEHLVQRIIARGRQDKMPYHVFIFSEKDKSVQELIKQLKEYLKNKNRYDLINPLEKIDKFSEQVNYLAMVIGQLCKPIFIFDNLETFQEMKSGEIKSDHAELAQVLTVLANSEGHQLLITSRHPLPGEAFENIATHNLNHVSLNDFWKKCHNLELKFIADYFRHKKTIGIQLEKEKVSFEDIVRYLHQSFGGNYRALEWFNKKIKADKGHIDQTLESLDAFREKYKDAELEVMQEMSQNLFFSQLTGLLSPKQANTLFLLTHFNIPVTAMALEMQNGNTRKSDLQNHTQYLQQLTLIEKLQPGPDLPEYLYVSPLVKGLLAKNPLQNTSVDFSNDQAGHYHLYAFHNLGTSLSDWEEAFIHFLEAKNREQVGELGLSITNFYFNLSLFQKALSFALPSFQLLQKDTPPNLLLFLGRIFRIFGMNDNASVVYDLALHAFKAMGDKAGEGTTLNNISQIWDTRGDYQKALEYLEQSLKIRREIGDKAGEGTTLNNFGLIFSRKGDYQQALEYYQQSLKIQREIGDKKNEGGLLNNISQIFKARGDYQKALSYLEQSLKIWREIGNKAGEGTTLNNLATTAYAGGDYQKALEYLEQALKIAREIGDKKNEGGLLNNISQIFQARGDYQKALEYLEQSLKIRREIGDKAGEGTTLNNISQIFQARGDYQQALSYLEQSLKIRREIGDKAGEGTTLSNIGLYYKVKGEYQKAIEYYEQSLKIRQEIGDKAGEGTTLNNLATTAYAGGDYQKALAYLEQSLKIAREIGDKKNEGGLLNNISQIWDARGDYQKALKYLEQSLKIRREIGDKAGEGTTLNNISQIWDARGDYQKALKYLEQSLKIRREIQNWPGVVITLFNMGLTCQEKEVNDLIKARKYLSECAEINKKIQHPEITPALKQMGFKTE